MTMSPSLFSTKSLSFSLSCGAAMTSARTASKSLFIPIPPCWTDLYSRTEQSVNLFRRLRTMLPIPEVPPNLLARLRTAPGRMPVEVHLVLEEDDYETKYGDGRFLALRAAFLDPAAAK